MMQTTTSKEAPSRKLKDLGDFLETKKASSRKRKDFEDISEGHEASSRKRKDLEDFPQNKTASSRKREDIEDFPENKEALSRKRKDLEDFSEAKEVQSRKIKDLEHFPENKEASSRKREDLEDILENKEASLRKRKHLENFLEAKKALSRKRKYLEDFSEAKEASSRKRKDLEDFSEAEEASSRKRKDFEDFLETREASSRKRKNPEDFASLRVEGEKVRPKDGWQAFSTINSKNPIRAPPQGFLFFALTFFSIMVPGSCHIRESHGPYMDVNLETLAPFVSPQVDPSHSRDVTALAGKEARLNCRVHNINNKTVSWIRHRDIHLLTVGRYTYTSDQRFRALHEEDSDDWVLKINYAQPRDSGMYECQISTTPPASHFIRLNVVNPQTHILGGPDMFINKGSTINLTCVIEFSPEPPDFIYWNHNGNIISYDSTRGGVTVIIEKGDLTTSSLLIQRAQPADSGRYDCNPSNIGASNITVHVLNGEHPAAIQHGGQATYTSSSVRNIMSLLVFLAVIHRFVE